MKPVTFLTYLHQGANTRSESEVSERERICLFKMVGFTERNFFCRKLETGTRDNKLGSVGRKTDEVIHCIGSDYFKR